MSFSTRTLLAMAAQLAGATLALSLGGCSFSERVGEVEMVSLGPSSRAFGREFTVGHYANRESEHSFWFSDTPLEALTTREGAEEPKDAVFLHAQMVWLPKAGNTPMQSSATNLVLRMLVLSNGEAGLYGGAGFATPDGDPGDETVGLSFEEGSLTLLEKTPGFIDLMSPAALSGTLSAKLSEQEANRWRRAVSQLAANAFGKPMWVRSETLDGARNGVEALASIVLAERLLAAESGDVRVRDDR
jgi:hypothetical protein